MDAWANLLRGANRYHDSDDLVRRRVKRDATTPVAQPNLVQRLLVRPRPAGSTDDRRKVPGSSRRASGRVVTAEYEPGTVSRRLEGGKHQALSLQPEVHQRKLEWRRLSQPHRLDRKEEVLPQLGQCGTGLHLAPGD